MSQMLYCNRWNRIKRKQAGSISEEEARRRYASGEPFCVVALSPQGSPIAFVEVGGGTCGAGFLDEHLRVYFDYVFEERDGRLFLSQAIHIRYEGESGKGKKDRMVPIGERAIRWIDKYLDEIRPSLVLAPDDGTLFVTQAGDAFSANRLTQLVREYVDRADLTKRGSCHLFRHTMATLMLEGGADIRYIQEMLGRVELSTTQIYTQVSIRKLKEVHERTHPGAAPERVIRHAPPEPEEPKPTMDDLLSRLEVEATEEDEENLARSDRDP